MLNKQILLQGKSEQTKSHKKQTHIVVLLKLWVCAKKNLAKKNLKAHIFLFKRRERKVDGFVCSLQYQPSRIPAGGLEIPLKLTFKTPSFKAHQKMKVFLTNLYLYNYEGKAETDEDDDAEFHFKIANKGLDDGKEEDSEVVEQTVKRKSQKG